MKNLCALLGGILLAMLPESSSSSDPSSQQFRLVGPGPASVAAVAQSPTYQAYVVGGGGQAVGISASQTYTNVAGGTSTQLPTDRIFRNEFEDQ